MTPLMQFEEWERLLSEGRPLEEIFGTRDIHTILFRMRDYLWVRAMRDCHYSMIRTSRMVGMNREDVRKRIQPYIPNYRELKKEYHAKCRRIKQREAYRKKVLGY